MLGLRLSAFKNDEEHRSPRCNVVVVMGKHESIIIGATRR